MDLSSVKFIAAVVGVVGTVRGWFKGRRTERAAGEAPESFKSIDQTIFDALLQRIAAAHPSDPMFKRFTDGATNKAFTPAILKTANVQDWLQDAKVKRDLKDAASAKLLGHAQPVAVMARLEARYGEIALASSQESAPVVASIVAMLAAAINAHVADTGTSALVVVAANETARSLTSVHDKIDKLVSRSDRDSSVPVPLVALDTKVAQSWRDAFSAASGALLRWPTVLGNGAHIARPELGQLLACMDSTERGTIALLGLPGSGKSALLARLGQELAMRPNVAVLAIKGDLVDSDLTTEDDLKRDLVLPELPSTMLRQLAALGPVAVLVDQLDALAGHLDAKTGRLSVLLNLIKAVNEVNGVHIFVSCRTFEFTHDTRLSRIDAESLTLELPSWEKVLSILEVHGVKAGGWNTDAREVVRVPQQLNTYLQLRAAGIDEPVSNYTAMLDQLWKIRVLAAPDGEGAAQLAFEIAEAMADKEALWLAGARFDHRAEDVKLLTAAGVLTATETGAIGFSHQTIFEHVLARSFSKVDGRLSSYVAARNDSLFVRPKLWAALAYLRGVEHESYETELASIWYSPGLRKHLRFLLIEFMGSQPKPMDKEELLLASACEPVELRAFVLKAITGSQGWFARFGSNVIAQAMADETTADLCVQLLSAAIHFDSDRVATLLGDHWLPAPANDRRALFVLQDAPAWTPALVKIAETICARVELSRLNADHFIACVGGANPVVAIDLLRRLLEGELPRARDEAVRLYEEAARGRPAVGEDDLAWHIRHNTVRPLEDLFEDSQNWGSIPALAAAAPADFLRVLWPWFVNVLRNILSLSESGLPRVGFPLASTADFRFEGEGSSKLDPTSLLEAIVVAVELVADASSTDFLRWAGEQTALELAAVQRLVAHGLARNPSQTASAALRFLLDDERRYFLGGISDHASSTISLVVACAPHWSDGELAQFIAKVKAYAPARPADLEEPESMWSWHQFVRRTRIRLLRALPPPQRTTEVQREIDEADRASPKSSRLDEFIGGWIGPRMDAAQFALATNDAILNAFREIPDGSGWDHPKHFGYGGNVQLARSFAEFARTNQVRALEIIAHLRPDFGQRAAGNGVEALAENVEPSVVMALVVDLHQRGFADAEFQNAVARAIDQLLRRDVVINDAVLRILESWIPSKAEVSTQDVTASAVSDEGSASSTETNDFLLSGHSRVEFVPCGDYPVLSCLIRAWLARKDVGAAIGILRKYLLVSQDKRIWEFLTRSMVALPSLDSKDGPTIVGEVLAITGLDGTRGAAFLMFSTHWTALGQVMSTLTRWRDSKSVAARRGYGELIALIALVNPAASEAKKRLEEMIEAPEYKDARVGAAATAVQLLWLEPPYRAGATGLLLRLLQTNEVHVWNQIFGLFALVDKLEAEPQTLRLLEGMAENIEGAPAPKEPHVVERLGALLPRHAAVVARIATHLIQLWRDKLANMGSAIGTAGQEMMDLAITLHRTDGTRLEGLQMFEQLVEIDAYQAREVLDELDHRVKLGARPMRPRLRRRGRRRAKR